MKMDRIGSFRWEDPFLLEDELTEEERIQAAGDSAADTAAQAADAMEETTTETNTTEGQ